MTTLTFRPMGKVGESPYYRAEGETDITNLTRAAPDSTRVAVAVPNGDRPLV